MYDSSVKAHARQAQKAQLGTFCTPSMQLEELLECVDDREIMWTIFLFAFIACLGIYPLSIKELNHVSKTQKRKTVCLTLLKRSADFFGSHKLPAWYLMAKTWLCGLFFFACQCFDTVRAFCANQNWSQHSKMCLNIATLQAPPSAHTSCTLSVTPELNTAMQDVASKITLKRQAYIQSAGSLQEPEPLVECCQMKQRQT